jgi:hypothetical protein
MKRDRKSMHILNSHANLRHDEDKRNKIVFVIISSVVLLYVFLRLVKLDATFDEVWTIEGFASQDYIDILNYTPCDANNHLLNTLLIKLIFSLGIKNLFFARIPNFIALIGYLFFSYKISNFLHRPFKFILFVLLLMNPFLLDFFSLARGYGLGICFQTASIFYLFLFVKTQRLKYNIVSLISASLASLSNFSQLNCWFAILLAIIAVIVFSDKINKTKFFIYNTITILIFILIIYEPLRKLVGGGHLYYGGNDNFYSDTLISLTKYTQYSSVNNTFTHIVLIVFLLCLLISLVFLVKKNLKNKCTFLTIENILFFIVFVSIASPIVQHYFLGTLYLIDRTALFYYPLLILLLCFCLSLYDGAIQKITLSIVTAFLFLNFIFSANFYKTALWYFDSHTQDILTQINEEGIRKNKTLFIDFSWPFQSSFNYYYDKNKTYSNMKIVNNKEKRGEVAPKTDYYIYLKTSLEKVGYEADKQKILAYKNDTLLFYKTEGIYVFKMNK